LDTSALVKNYHPEPGSDWVRAILHARETSDQVRIYISEITIAECAAAFAVLARTKRIRNTVRDALYREFLADLQTEFQTIQVRREEINHAAQLTQDHDLKGYDAIQLAVALYVNDLLKEDGLSLAFVSGDANLLQAAQAEGIATENPFDHRDLDTAR